MLLEYKNASRCICAHDVFMQMHLCRTQKEREHVDVGRLHESSQGMSYSES